MEQAKEVGKVLEEFNNRLKEAGILKKDRDSVLNIAIEIIRDYGEMVEMGKGIKLVKAVKNDTLEQTGVLEMKIITFELLEVLNINKEKFSELDIKIKDVAKCFKHLFKLAEENNANLVIDGEIV